MSRARQPAPEHNSAQLDRLVKMVNQIAANFRYESDTEAAARAIADHLHKFWSAPMREKILAHAAEGGVGLVPLARAALVQLAKLSA